MPRAQKWLWTAHEEEWGPIKRIRMVSPDLEHGFPESGGFSGTLLPLFIEIHHEARSRFVVHVPQTEQQRLGACVQKSPHQAQQVIAARHLAHAGLTAAQRHQIGRAND